MLAIILVNGNHWVLGAIKLKKKIIAIFDSMLNRDHSVSFRRLFMISDLAFRKLNRPCDASMFKFYLAFDNPRKMNNDDCGLFVCRTIKGIFRRNPRKFKIATGEYRRELVETLDNDVIIREPFIVGSRRNNQIKNVINQSYLINNDFLQLEINSTQFSELIKMFF